MQDFAVSVAGKPDRGPAVFTVTTATLVLATVFVLARVVSRCAIVRRFGWDDWSIVIAWLFALGIGVAINLGTRKGLGRHDEDILHEDRGTLRRCEYVFSVLYNPALMAAKTSILIFYLRLSKNTQPLLRLASYVTLAIVNVAGTILTCINIFQCQPVQAAFDHVPGDSRCVPLLTEFICSAPINIVTDLAILALPLPVLTGMRLPPRQKTILVLTFALGVFVTIVDVVRIYYLQQAIDFIPSTASTTDQNAIFGDSPQFSWNASLSLMWSAVEVNVGIMCACIPTLKPLIMKILPAMLVDPDGTRSGSMNTQDKDTIPSARTPQQVAFGAGGGMQAPPPSHPPSAGDLNDNEHITALDFLTTPDMLTSADGQAHSNHASGSARRSTATTLGRLSIGPESNVYFGFVNIKRPKSMLRASVSDSWKYCTLVTVLFLLWGISYGLLGTLNSAVAIVADMNMAQTLGLTSIYFGGGYFVGPLVVGMWILRHDEHHRSRHNTAKHKPHESIGGFKATFMLGLCIYGVGTIMFWPAAVLASFPGFMICNFVVGSGLAVLETAANPFLALCGPAKYAEMRLCLAQGVQAVGSVLSGLMAQHVYFATISRDQPTADSLVLADVQWTYLGVTLLCVALALLFYYIPIPEVTDHELEKAAEKLPVDSKKQSIGGLKLRTVCIILAVLAQWTYVAAQESMSIYFRGLITALVPQDLPVGAAASVSSGSGSSGEAAAARWADHPAALVMSVSSFMVIGHSAFAVSRFIAGGLAFLVAKHPDSMLVPAPRMVLAASTVMQLATTVAIITMRPSEGTNPNLIAIPIVLFFFAEGPAWPLIFAMGLRGQGRRTKVAAAWLTMGASGPAFWPFVMYAIVNSGGSVQVAFCVVAALLCFTMAYPAFLCFRRDAKGMVDPGRESVVGGEAEREGEVDIDTLLARRMRRRDESREWEGAGSVGVFEKLRLGVRGLHQDRRASDAGNISPRRTSAAVGLGLGRDSGKDDGGEKGNGPSVERREGSDPGS